ncbi:MAG: 2-hydroxyacyl-CoA dehydratase family protein [Planctomycetota bacterium]|nr:2-hydroxyacyl-CoA dehydratase family protein [Planctomycetota bacterium]
MKTVIYSSPFVPAEWLAAHGVRPQRIRPDPAAALPSTAPLAGVCPYARAFIGDVLARGGADAAVLATTCDQMRRAAEWLAASGGPQVFLLNVPATWQTPAAARLYRDELQRLGRFLVELGGQTPTQEFLAETIAAYDARRQSLRGALGSLSARQASDAIAQYDLGEEGWQGHATARDHATRRSNSPDPPRGTPVALIGGPLMRGDERLFDLISHSGGRVVLDGTESGPRTLPAPVDRRRLKGDPLLELMDAYFGAIPDAFRRPDTALYAWLARELAASGARGVIVWRYVWCDMWAASATRLREMTGLPVLDLDVSGDESGHTRAAGRIQAFMEVLR